MSIAHINGTDLFYTEYGTGLPCLVMHGGLGLDHVHLRVLDALGDVLHLVYYDHGIMGALAALPWKRSLTRRWPMTRRRYGNILA